MAAIKKNADYMALPASIKRGQSAPLDTTAVWYSKAELDEYAQNGATAYVGQIVTLYENEACSAYMIAGLDGTLIKLAATTASGDLAGDVATLNTQVANLMTKVGAAADGETPATGLYKEIADVLAIAEGKVSSVSGSSSIEVTGTTEPVVSVKVSAEEGNSLSIKDDGLFVEVAAVEQDEYSVTKLETATEGMSSSYQLTKNGVGVGAVIDIPKDMVVESGTVETYTEGGLPAGVNEAGTYIVLTLANATSDKLYIKASDLIEYNTSGSVVGDMVMVNIDPDTHKITASITNGTITKEKLTADIQTSLENADSAVQKVITGTTAGTISVDGLEVPVAGLGSAAYVTVESLNQSGTEAAAAAKDEVIGSAADGSDADTIKGAKKYAEEKADAAQEAAIAEATAIVNKLDVVDEAAAKQFVTAVSQTDGKIAVVRRGLTADDVPELAQSKISGLDSALAAKQDVITFNTEYDAATNKAATMGDVGTAKSAVVGTGEDAASVDTVKGAKKYADEAAASALADAKAYVDGITTGDTGVGPRLAAVEAKLEGVEVVTESIATAKNEAITAAAADATSKVDTAKVDILGEKGYNKTVKDAYELADSKTTMAEVEAKGYATTTAVTEAIAGVQETIDGLTQDNTSLEARVKANEDAITTLNGSESVEGSVDKKVADAINDFATKVSDDDTINTFKELIDYAAAHKGEYSTLSGEVEKNTKAITTLNGDSTQAGSVDKKIADAISPISADIDDIKKTPGYGITTEQIAQWTAAQANVIEKVKVGGVEQTVIEKAVDITSISTDLLATGTMTLILDCGGAEVDEEK